LIDKELKLMGHNGMTVKIWGKTEDNKTIIE